MQAGSPFRPDIEGLRAIAVLSVVLYHFDVPGFGSGFIGVDIFFVISGFLITGLLVREAQRTQRIDLLRFWGRRSARLLPNALLTLAVTFGCVMTLAPVLTREASGRDFAAALLYFANFHFAARALDYFDQGQQASPILHFWSLSVEEQFYGVWPICIALGLMVFKRFNRLSTLLFLFVVTTTSLWAMVHWAKYQPSRSFFDTEARVWQLATGAMLAVWLSGPTPRRQGSAAIGWFGLAGIFLSIAFLGQLPLNPRIASIAPTIAMEAVQTTLMQRISRSATPPCNGSVGDHTASIFGIGRCCCSRRRWSDERSPSY